MDKPDFEALRAERNARVREFEKKLCDKLGWDHGSMKSSFDPNACYCNCPAGPCEHTWDGPGYVSEDGCLSSATCSRCGTTAFSHHMRMMP